MKKLFVILVTLFCGISSVDAATYYSDYGDYSEWSTTKKVASDVVNVEKERRYKYYHEDIDGDYYALGENPIKYSNVDMSNTKQIYTDWQFDEIKAKENRTIDTRIIYKYHTMLPVRYIQMSDVNGSYGSLRMTELGIYNGNTPINYSVSCNGCNDNFETLIKDSNIHSNFSHILNGGNITIDLNGYYMISDLNMKMYFYDVGSEIKRYTLKITRNLEEHGYANLKYEGDFFSTSLDDIKEYDYGYDNFTIDNIQWGDTMYSLDKITSDKNTQAGETIQYSSYDTLYYYYNSTKTYSDIKTEYYNKEDSHTDYYRYKVRDKVVISDDVELTSLTDLPNKFILESTVPVTITGDVDINNNGTYKVKYITPFITVEKDIIVNISNELKALDKNKTEIINKINQLNNTLSKEQNVNEYNDMIEELNNSKIELNRVNSLLTAALNNLKIKEDEKTKMSREFENTLLNLKLNKDAEIKNLNEQVDKQNNEIQANNGKNKICIIISIIIILIICMMIYIIKKKD